jgi:hypothetical protein
VLLVVFNSCFVLPLVGIVAVQTFAGEEATGILARWRAFLERQWPQLLAALILIVGIVALLFGVSGLVAQGSGRLGRLFRHLRHVLHLHP